MFDLIIGVLKLSGERKKKIIASYILTFFDGMLNNAPIFVIGYSLYLIMSKGLTENTPLQLFCILLVSCVLRFVFKYIISVLEQGMGIFTFAEQRILTGEKVKRFEMGYFSDDNVGNLTSIFANDLRFIEGNGMAAMGTLTASILSVLVSIVMLIFMNSSVAVVYIAISVIAYFVLKTYYKAMVAQGKKQRETSKEAVDAIIEYVSSMTVIKAFHLEGDRFSKTEKAFKNSKDVNLGFEKAAVPYVVWIIVITALGTALLAGVGAYNGVHTVSSLPFMIMVVIFSMQSFAPLNAIGLNISLLNMSKAALERYDELRNIKVIDEVTEDIKIQNHEIVFDNVHFSYEEKEALKGITLTIPERKMTALVGRSGSGKTTITNLIARFWDADSGRVTIGGVDISKISTEELYKHISMVFQNVFLFGDTIYNNISMGKENATKEEVYQAAKKARCYDFIMALPDGFDTMVTSGGTSLSGGEKQRISIARAILKDAPIVLLDEATASVDLDNERYIQQAINELVKEKTLVVIAHKLSSIKHADKIIVVDDGAIVQEGTHDTLLSTDGIYKDLWQKRLERSSWKIVK